MVSNRVKAVDPEKKTEAGASKQRENGIKEERGESSREEGREGGTKLHRGHEN